MNLSYAEIIVPYVKMNYEYDKMNLPKAEMN